MRPSRSSPAASVHLSICAYIVKLSVRTTSPVGIARIATSHCHHPLGRPTALFLTQQRRLRRALRFQSPSTNSGGGRYVRGSYILLSRRLSMTNAMTSTPSTAAFVMRAVRNVCESFPWAFAADTDDIVEAYVNPCSGSEGIWRKDWGKK